MHSTHPTLLAALRRHWVVVLRNSLIAAVVIGAASFLVRNKYTASAVLLPPNYSSDVSSLLSSLPGTLQFTRALGLDTGGGTDLYVGVLRSTTIARRLVERFGLVQVYRQKDVEKAGRRLASHTSIQLTNEGFVKVAVTETNRRLGADLANAYVEELDRFLRVNSNTGARRRREFLENRITDARSSLTAMEDSLRDYQVRHRIPVVGTDVDHAAESASDLVTQKVSREIELGILESVARQSNPRAEELRNELRQIVSEIVKIPPAATELARLFRSVKMQEKVLLVLTEEYERARVLELKNIPTVQVVDRAVPPIHKSQPRRTLVVVAALLLVFAGNSVLVWAREGALDEA